MVGQKSNVIWPKISLFFGGNCLLRSVGRNETESFDDDCWWVSNGEERGTGYKTDLMA